jgi:hypothetical protein
MIEDIFYDGQRWCRWWSKFTGWTCVLIRAAYIITCLVTRRGGFGLVIGFAGLSKLTTTIIALLLILMLCSPLQHALSLLSLLCPHRLSPINGSQCHRFLGFHVLWLWSLMAAMSHYSSWSQPLAIVCVLAVSVHHWLVLTACRLTISTANHSLQLHFGPQYIALGRVT